MAELISGAILNPESTVSVSRVVVSRDALVLITGSSLVGGHGLESTSLQVWG